MKSEEIKNRIGELPEEVRKMYANTLALRHFIKDREWKFSAAVAVANDGSSLQVLNPANAIAGVAAVIMNEEVSHLAAAKAMVEPLEASDAFKNARDAIEPLIAELKKYEAAEEAERVRIEQLKQAVRDAEAASEWRILSEVGRDQKVIAAKRELEKALRASAEVK